MPSLHSEFVLTLADSKAFAELSGDFNPLHIDPIVARRLLFGSTVAHGVHVTLRALDFVWARSPHRAKLRALRTIFLAPPVHGANFTVAVSEKDRETALLSVTQDGSELQRIALTWTDADSEPDCPIPEAPRWRREPAELEFTDTVERAGTVPLALDRGRLAALFPVLAESLPTSQLAVLLAASRIVGMECPGRRSLFAELTLRFAEPAADAPAALEYRTRRSDYRMSLVQLGLKGAGAEGELVALFRPDPVAQPHAASLATQVRPGEFAKQRALVVGGSRGLGEVTAKLLGLGGAEVAITFAHGCKDADAVGADIRSVGGSCNSLHFDVTNPAASLAKLKELDFCPTHVYYFATPGIRSSHANTFNVARFHAYCDFYVEGLLRTMAAVQSAFEPAGAPLALFYPSTVFVDEVPRGFAEYAAAKAAGEVACRSLLRTRRGLRISCPRLPSLKTDQTSGVRGGSTVEPVSILLELLRKFH